MSVIINIVISLMQSFLGFVQKAFRMPDLPKVVVDYVPLIHTESNSLPSSPVTSWEAGLLLLL